MKQRVLASMVGTVVFVGVMVGDARAQPNSSDTWYTDTQVASGQLGQSAEAGGILLEMRRGHHVGRETGREGAATYDQATEVVTRAGGSLTGKGMRDPWTHEVAGSTSASIGDGSANDNGVEKRNDNRENLLVSAYLGNAVDNFAGSEFLTYLNPEGAGPTERRLIFGFDFEFRLTGDRDKPVTPKNSQLWIYGETLHGVRSRDIECTSEGEAPSVCGDLRNKNLFPTVADIPGRAAFIIENATSFEGYLGVRWEFLGINQAENNQPKDTAAALYLKAQAGLLAMAPDGGQDEGMARAISNDSVDNHVVAVGVVATNGRMSGSYVEAGFGRTDLFLGRSRGRWKFDGLLSFDVGKDWISPFVQIVVDSDFGGGADSIQSFVGIDFDVAKLVSLEF